MEMKSAEIEIEHDSFHSWDYHTGAGIEISILKISVRFRWIEAKPLATITSESVKKFF